MPIQNAEIATLLDQTAELLEIEGANPFRVRAYRRAARTIEGLPQSAASLVAAGRDLSELPGIGEDLAGKIVQIVKTGQFVTLDALKKELPGEFGAMAALPGLGAKRVKRLYDELGVRSLADLRRAVEARRLRELKGFGEKIEQKLLAALAKARRREQGSSCRRPRRKPMRWSAISSRDRRRRGRRRRQLSAAARHGRRSRHPRDVRATPRR